MVTLVTSTCACITGVQLSDTVVHVLLYTGSGKIDIYCLSE